MILALDLGTKTGWALDTVPRITSGTEDFKQGKFAGGGQRFLAFERWVEAMLLHPAQHDGDTGHYNVTEVVFEAVRRHIGTDAAHIYGGLLAILTKTCESHGIPYLGVPVQTIKKFITGSGNASKDAVVDAVRSKGYKPTDDNEADAISLLLCHKSRI